MTSPYKPFFQFNLKPDRWLTAIVVVCLICGSYGVVRGGGALSRIQSSAAIVVAPIAGQAHFGSCYARWSNDEVVIGNEYVERKWRIANGLLHATSLRDKRTNSEWVRHPASQPAPLPPFALPQQERRSVRFTSRSGPQSPLQASSLVVEMTADGASATLKYSFQIFPDARGVSVQMSAAPKSATVTETGQAPKDETRAATGIEQNSVTAKETQHKSLDTLEEIEVAARHLRLTQVELLDQTDIHNELVHEREWLLHPNESNLRLQGNLFFVEDPLTGAGLIFLKQAPLPHAQPIRTEHDFSLDARGMSTPLPKVDPATGQLVPTTAKPTGYRLTFVGNGIDKAGGEGYRFVTLAYAGGRSGRIEALQIYQRQLRQYDSLRDGMFLSNTWGDRARDARINAEFIRREIEAGVRLGVDVVQIDDGWQVGRTQNSASAGGTWNGFWASDPNFWDVNPGRFPAGLKPLIDIATNSRIKFGLWYAPDSSQNFANWERDARRILELHRTLGITYFKLDAVKATTKESERNFRRFYESVLRESAGRIVFDLDVTAEVRPGYFGAIEAGPVFIENRYTDAHRYFPHQTLRNLWSLAQHVDPLRLRLEFLNNTRNQQLYEDDPLAPARYRPAYLFATTMFANPLGWFETSNLPADYVREVADLVRVWKSHRQEMFSNPVMPIGQKPDGVSWTGFTSVNRAGRSGYLLLFRELTASAEVSLEVPAFTENNYRVTPLAGSGTLSVSGGRVSLRMPEALSFLFVKVSAE